MSVMTNLPFSASVVSHSRLTPYNLRHLPNSTLVPLASSASQNVPQCIPNVLSLLMMRCMSSESAGEQWRDEVRIY